MKLQKGQLVIYRKKKHTTHPSGKAKNIQPTQRGEYYDYTVDKYWVVFEVTRNCIYCKTKNDKIVMVESGDPSLIKANLFYRIFKRYLFPF